MDYRASGFWLSVAQWVFNATVLIWMAVGSKRQAAKKRVNELEGRVGLVEQNVGPCASHRKQTSGMEKIVTELRAEVKHLPSQQSIEELNRTLAELKGQVKGLARATDLINEYLINKGGKV